MSGDQETYYCEMVGGPKDGETFAVREVAGGLPLSIRFPAALSTGVTNGYIGPDGSFASPRFVVYRLRKETQFYDFAWRE